MAEFWNFVCRRFYVSFLRNYLEIEKSAMVNVWFSEFHAKRYNNHKNRPTQCEALFNFSSPEAHVQQPFTRGIVDAESADLVG